MQYIHTGLCRTHNTGRPRPIGCLRLQVIFRKRTTNYRTLLQKMTYNDKASYGSSPPCIYIQEYAGHIVLYVYITYIYYIHILHVCVYLDIYIYKTVLFEHSTNARIFKYVDILLHRVPYVYIIYIRIYVYIHMYI